MAQAIKNPYWGAAAEVLASLNEQAALDRAEQNYRQTYQDMMAKRREGLEKQRTNAETMTKFNAIGNALRTMVQPLGWAIGGATAGVQKYDNRAYLDAFNRALKADNDLAHLDAQDMQFQLSLAGGKVADAKRAYEQRIAEERAAAAEAQKQQNQLELIAAKKAGEPSEQEKILQARRTNAVKAYHDLVRSDSIHGKGVPSFADFIDMGGYGRDFYGDWNPTEEEIRSLAGEQAAESGDSAAQTPTNGGTAATRPATKTTGGSVSKGGTKSSSSGSSAKTDTTATKSGGESSQDVNGGSGRGRGELGLGTTRAGIYARNVRKNSGLKSGRVQKTREAMEAQTAAERWGGTAKKKKN